MSQKSTHSKLVAKNLAAWTLAFATIAFVGPNSAFAQFPGFNQKSQPLFSFGQSSSRPNPNSQSSRGPQQNAGQSEAELLALAHQYETQGQPYQAAMIYRELSERGAAGGGQQDPQMMPRQFAGIRRGHLLSTSKRRQRSVSSGHGGAGSRTPQH